MGDGLRWMKVRVSERALSSCICEEMICNPISPHLAAATSCTNISLKLGSRETARLTSQGPEHDSDCCYALLPAVCVCVCVWYLSPQCEKRHCGDRTPHRCMLGVGRLAELCVAPEKHTDLQDPLWVSVLLLVWNESTVCAGNTDPQTHLMSDCQLV